MDGSNLKQGLAQFTGTDNHYNHLLTNLTYTSGVKFFAKNAGGGAYWFIDIIGIELLELNKTEPFMMIKLIVINSHAYISATDGNNHQLYYRKIESTDCPDGEWKFYLIKRMMLLPDEY